jgi:transcriptional regulator with XRE-family HTH domain
LPDGSIQVGNGTYVGAGGDTRVENTPNGPSLVAGSGLIEVRGVPGLQPGLYVINSNNASVYQARIPGYAEPEKPSFKDQLDADIPSLEDLAATRKELPIGWKDEGAFYGSDDNYAVIPRNGQPHLVVRMNAEGRLSGDTIAQVRNWAEVSAAIEKDQPEFDKEIARLEEEATEGQLPIGRIPGATAEDVISAQDLLKMQEQRTRENEEIDAGKPAPQPLGNKDLNGNTVPDGWVRSPNDDNLYTREMPLRDGGTYPIIARLQGDGKYIAGTDSGWIPEPGTDGRGPSRKFDTLDAVNEDGVPGLVEYLNGTFTKDNPIEYSPQQMTSERKPGKATEGESLGKEIYERRIATGDSLDKVAEDLGLTRVEVRRLESEYARSLEGKKKDDKSVEEIIMDPPKGGGPSDPEARAFAMADTDAQAIIAIKSADVSTISIPDEGISFDPKRAEYGLAAIKTGDPEKMRLATDSIWELVQSQREALLKEKYPEADLTDVKTFNKLYAQEFYGLGEGDVIKVFKGGYGDSGGASWRTAEGQTDTYFSTNPYVAAEYARFKDLVPDGKELTMFSMDLPIEELPTRFGQGSEGMQGSLEFPQVITPSMLAAQTPQRYNLPNQVYGTMSGGRYWPYDDGKFGGRNLENKDEPQIIMDPPKDGGNPPLDIRINYTPPSDNTPVEEKVKADQDYVEKMKGLYGFEREKALRDYEQQGPHDPLDPAYNDEFKNEFEGYLSEDGSPDGVFNDLLRSNPDFARLFAWHQFDQAGSPIHADFQPSDSDARERFDAEDAKHALIEDKYGNDSPTPAVAVGAGLNVLMAPDYFYYQKKEKLDALKDALKAFQNPDMREDLKNNPEELAAVESVTKSIEAEIAKLEGGNTPELTQVEKPALDKLVSKINKNDGYEANGLNFRINTGAFGAKDDNIEVTPTNWEPGDPIVARIDMDGGIDWENDAQFDKYADDMGEALNRLDSPNAPKEISDDELLDRRLAGESLDVVAEDLGISREEVRRREANAYRKRMAENPEIPPTPEGLDAPDNKELIAKFNRQYVKEFLDQEEALADKYEAEEDMPRGDAQAVAEADMRRMYGKTAAEALGELPRDEAMRVLEERENKINEEVVPDISEPPTQSDVVAAIDVNSPNLQEEIQSAIDKGQKIAFSYNGKERVVLPKGIWTNPKNGNVNLRAIEDGTDGGLKVFTLDKMEMAKGVVPTPPNTTKPKELSEGDKAVIKNNAFVEENAGSLQPIPAEDVQVGDFIWNAFYGRYEEVLSNKYAGVMNRMEMEVFNVKNGQKEIRYFEMDSPLRNVRRPGIEDQAEPIPSAKAAPRGGKRNVIKRKRPSERVVAKTGRRMGGNFENEGFYNDMNGVPLVPGDVVIHKNPGPNKGGKWKRGVVKLRVGAQVEEGKKAGAVGRDEVAYLDYLFVQWEGEDGTAALNQGGRQVKAKNLQKFDGSIDGMVMPEFRGGNVEPNAPTNPAPAAEPRRFPPTTGERQAIERPVAPANPAPEQGRLVDTPEVKPAAPAGPGMPKPIYKAEVEDQKGNKFKISVIKIDDMYEAAVFNENGDLNAVIAKNTSLGEVQGVIGNFIGEVADSNDGEKVLRAYGGFPDPVEQLALEGDTPDVPPLPEVKAIDLKEAKARAKELALAIQDKDLPGDARKDLSENEQARMKNYIQQYLSPSGVDRRQNGKLNDELRVAYRYAVRLGWFEEAQQIAAIQKRVDKLPLREGSPDLENKIAELRAMHPELFGMELELAKRLDYNGRKRVESLMNALNDMLVNPDVYNPNFRSAVIKARGDIDAILASIDRPNPVPTDAVVIDKMKEFKKRFDSIDLPKLPSREKGNDDAQNHLADIAREFEGLSIDDLRNGVGDWKFDKELSAGINKVYLLRNALTGERIVIKYDNDGNRGAFQGNGIKAEEMVAVLYRDLGFAQPAFVAVNPDNPNVEVGGVGVMQYADAGFFGLVNIDVHNRSGVYSLSEIAPEHREELLHFMIANAVIGNSDRHGGNFMWGTDPVTGKARLVPIDNGLAIFNAGFGKPQESPNDPLYVNPYKVIGGDYGNRNQVGRLAKQQLMAGFTQDQINRGEHIDAAIPKVIEFATRMRERAEALKFVDPKANEYLMARADFILKNPQKFVDTLLKFW